jgi:hypothetical protein
METKGDFCRSRTARSLESSNNRITCKGGHSVRMIYHSQTSSLTAPAHLAAANLDLSRSAKTRTSPGSLRRTKAILRCRSMLRKSTCSRLIHFSSETTITSPGPYRKQQFCHIWEKSSKRSCRSYRSSGVAEWGSTLFPEERESGVRSQNSRVSGNQNPIRFDLLNS